MKRASVESFGQKILDRDFCIANVTGFDLKDKLEIIVLVLNEGKKTYAVTTTDTAIVEDGTSEDCTT